MHRARQPLGSFATSKYIQILDGASMSFNVIGEDEPFVDKLLSSPEFAKFTMSKTEITMNKPRAYKNYRLFFSRFGERHIIC